MRQILTRIQGNNKYELKTQFLLINLEKTMISFLLFQSNVFPQTPDPDPGAGVYKSYETGEQKNQSLVTSRSQLEPQHKIQTLAESPELSAHQLQASPQWHHVPAI